MGVLNLILKLLVFYVCVAGWTVATWASLWFLIEISLMSFVGMVVLNMSYGVSEMVMKYFIVQVVAGVVLLVCILTSCFGEFGTSGWLLLSGISVKLGLAPVHSWSISVVGKMGWGSFVFMMSFMKLLPVVFIVNLAEALWLGLLLSITVLAGSVLGVNNQQIQKLLAYSGMVGICWLVLAATESVFFFFFFFLGYSFILLIFCYFISSACIYYIGQFKFLFSDLFSSVLLLLGFFIFCGFPPFLGFILKWVMSCWLPYSGFGFVLILLVGFSLFSLYYYFQLYYYFLLICSFNFKWYGCEGRSQLWFLLLFVSLTSFFLLYLFN